MNQRGPISRHGPQVESRVSWRDLPRHDSTRGCVRFLADGRSHRLRAGDEFVNLRVLRHQPARHRACRNTARGDPAIVSYHTLSKTPSDSSTVLGYPRSPEVPSAEMINGSDQFRP